MVVGAGVIGLTTAVCLAEAGRRVAVVAADPPERTTSIAAGAMVGPVFVARSDPGGAREHDTFDEFVRLASVPGTGVRISTGRFAAKPGGPARTAHPPADRCGAAGAGRAAGTVHVRLSGQRPVRRYAAIPGVPQPPTHRRRRRDRDSSAGQHRGDGVVGAAGRQLPGVGARALVPDPSVRPVRGQHVIVENPGLDTFFIEAPFGPSWTSSFPHGGHLVLGGIAVPDDWSLEPDLEIADEILARCVAAEPQLAGARVIIAHRVGLRPARPEVRLEVQELEGTRIVHDYGHGGNGVALSWGCAREASALLTGSAP